MVNRNFNYVGASIGRTYVQFETSINLKHIHAMIHRLIIILVIVALTAVFHNFNSYTNLYSLHSCVGLTTVILSCLQYVNGFGAFLFPGISRLYRIILNAFVGPTLFVKAVASCLIQTNISALSVGRKYIDMLRSVGRYLEAAKICSFVLGNNIPAWEAELEEFSKSYQLRVLAPFVPVDVKKATLSPTSYERILREFLVYDTKGFLALIKTWPTELHNTPVVMNLANHDFHFMKPEEDILESLAELYEAEKQYENEKAFVICPEISNKKQVFELIRSFNMFNVIHEKLELLMELDANEATQVLLEQLERVPVDLVVSKLKHKPNLLYVYLDKLFLKEPEAGENYHGLLMELYAEHAPDRLLPFLQRSNSYPLEDALKICQQRNYIEAMVFLLGRMGNTKQALHYIVKNLGNVEAAINFCKEYDDKELWEDLIEYSLDKPHFITVLLQNIENIGTYIDPILIIQKIPEKKDIPGLRDFLIKIFEDYNIQISLREGCKKILVSEHWSLMERITKQQKKGLQIQDDDVCQGCRRKIIVKDCKYASNVVVFYCRHSFHEECLHTDSCSICIAQNKSPSFSGGLGRW